MSQTIETHRVKTFNFWAIFHTLFGLSLMFFGRYIPSPTLTVSASQRLMDMGFTEVNGMVTLCISPLGMTILMLFLGVVYLWSAVDTYWPGLLGVFLLGLSDYGTMNQVLSQFMGNPMTVYIFFLMVFCGALVHSNISEYLARFLMTLPVVKGRPWRLTAMVLLTHCFLPTKSGSSLEKPRPTRCIIRSSFLALSRSLACRWLSLCSRKKFCIH